MPVQGRNSGKLSILITRRITAADGSFGGVIVVSIDPSCFSQFFNKVDLGPHGVVTLLGLDGIVRARGGLNDLGIGQNLSDTALFKKIMTSAAGSEIEQSHLDGLMRVYGYASVSDYPLIVSVGIGLNDVLAASARERASNFAIGGILTVVIITLGWFLAHETKRRRERELAEHAELMAREQKVLLDRAVNNMHHGLLMFNKDRRAVVINQTYIEMYRLSPETTKFGCTVRELLEQRAANGTFSGDVEGYIENEISGDTVRDKVFEIPDGRSIRVVNRPVNDGGWVSTHEDVTAQRKAADEIRAYAEREQLFIAAVESSNDAIVTEDLEGVITGWNEAAERLFGYTAQEVVGKRIDIIVPEELRHEVRAILIKIKTGEKVEHYETVRVKKSGERIDVSISVSPIKSQTGVILGAAKVSRDISARKERKPPSAKASRCYGPSSIPLWMLFYSWTIAVRLSTGVPRPKLCLAGRATRLPDKSSAISWRRLKIATRFMTGSPGFFETSKKTGFPVVAMKHYRCGAMAGRSIRKFPSQYSAAMMDSSSIVLPGI